MRCLLISLADNSLSDEYKFSTRENLGVEYLLSALRGNGYHADSINLNISDHLTNFDFLITQYEIVGFSLPFWEFRKNYVNFINSVTFNKETIVIAGGHSATIGAHYFLSQCKRLNGIVMGEGEDTVVDIANKFPLTEGIKGVFTRNGFSPRKLRDINSLSFPSRDECLRVSKINKLKEAYLVSSRGCTYNCSFCSIDIFYSSNESKGWRFRSPQNINEEILALTEIIPNLQLISFTDDNFLGNNNAHKNRAKKIASYIKSLNKNLLFEFACRVDTIDYDTFSEFYDDGLSGVFLGIESGIQKVLDSFHKKTLVKQNIEAIKILSEIGVGCDIGFIMYNKSITLNEVLDNFYFLKSIYESYHVYVHPITLLREEKEYPKDLGESFLLHDSTDINYEDKRIPLLKNYLDELWQHDYRQRFLELEKLAVLENSQQAIENSRELTKFMIDDGIKEIEQLIKNKSYA